MGNERQFVVDRIEGHLIVLVDDNGHELDVGVDKLAPVREGQVIRVPLDSGGQEQWLEAEVDHDETKRRAAQVEEILRDLRSRDPTRGQ